MIPVIVGIPEVGSNDPFSPEPFHGSCIVSYVQRTRLSENMDMDRAIGQRHGRGCDIECECRVRFLLKKKKCAKVLKAVRRKRTGRRKKACVYRSRSSQTKGQKGITGRCELMLEVVAYVTMKSCEQIK